MAEGFKGTTAKSKDEEEAELKKLMKEKSASLLGQSLVKLGKICMPKCVSGGKDSYMSPEETRCLTNCVASLHKTHSRVFNYLLGFEKEMSEHEKTAAVRRAWEEEQAALRQAAQVRTETIEAEGLVKM